MYISILFYVLYYFYFTVLHCCHSTDESDINPEGKENRISSAGTSEVKLPSRHKSKKGDRTPRSESHLKPGNTNEEEHDKSSHIDAKAMASALYDLKSLSEALLNMNDEEDV
jgi:hypothetical protein